MGPQHGVTHSRIDLIDDADEPFGSDDGAQSTDARARAGAQNHRRFIADAAAVQRFGGDESPAQSRSQSNQFSESIVLALEGPGLHRAEREAVEVSLLRVGGEQRLSAALGAFLQHHQRREKATSHAGGDGFAHGIGESTRREREDNASRHYYQVEPGVAAERAVHVYLKSLGQTSISPRHQEYGPYHEQHRSADLRRRGSEVPSPARAEHPGRV